MSEPDDISQEAWDEAIRLWRDDELDPGEVIIARAIMAAEKRGEEREREAIIQVCEAEKVAFLSPEYANPQPVGSICERFAIDECIAAIRKREERP